jgi:hypothetical protein
MTDFEQDLKLFVEKSTYLIPVIKNDLEAIIVNKHGCKSSAINARNKLKELIDLARKLKKSSLVKSNQLPKRKQLKTTNIIKNELEEADKPGMLKMFENVELMREFKQII